MSEPGAAPNPEQVAHGRPAVERWLAWSGLVPLPVFLALHLSRELSLAAARDVSELVRPAPSLLASVTSAVLVWLPLVVHALLGAWLLATRRPTTVPAANLGGDVPAIALRVSRYTSGIALLFILYHAREYPIAVWLGEADARDAGLRLVARLSATTWGVPLRGGLYLLGLSATIAHAGLALHRGLLREGLLGTQARRRRSARLCVAIAAALFGLGAGSVIRVASGTLLN